MADIRPFRAFRYNLGRVGALSDVIAPPYDVIDPALQQTLYDRSPYNVIRLILNQESPADTERDNRYTRSAGCLREWLAEDIITQDSARALYAYHQDYTVEGRTFTRKGVLARVRLEPFGTGRIYPHEQTLSGPKADRLKLFHATGMNLSPIFGLYPDPGQVVGDALERAIGTSLAVEATDHLGTVSKLWTVTDSTALSAVGSYLANQPVFIADGHHRYETGLRYRQDRIDRGEAIDDEHPANFILMMLVGMSDPGLLILPTHRLLSGLPEMTGSGLREKLGGTFDIETIGTGEAAAKETWERIEMDGGQDVLGFGTVADGGWHLARYRAPEEMARLAPEKSEAWRGLGVAILHVQVIGAILGQATCRYVHLMGEVLEDVAAKRSQLAVLVPPATMDHVAEIAGNLETMPPKSTYFYPKLLSGLLFNSLKVWRATMGVFDQCARFAARTEVNSVLARLRPLAGLALAYREWFGTRTMPLPGGPDRDADLAAVADDADGQAWLTIFEFQSEHDPEKIEVLLVEAAVLYRHARDQGRGGGRLRPLPVFVYLKGRCGTPVLDLRTPTGLGNHFAPVVWEVEGDSARETLAQVEAGAVSWGALFWVSLMAGAEDEAVIDCWRRLRDTVAPPALRADLTQIALVFAELVGLRKDLGTNEGGRDHDGVGGRK